MPRVHSITEIHGGKTFLIDYSVTVAMNEAHLYRGTVPFLLSNVWSVQHSLDDLLVGE